MANKPAMDFNEAVARSRAVADRLNTATDAMNKVILEAERAITELQLGVPGWVQMFHETQTDEPWYEALTFVKPDGKTWRLMVEVGPDRDPDRANVTPLANSSRETRLAAINHLPALVQMMVDRAEQEVARVESQ